MSTTSARMLDHFVRDVRYATRTLRRAPAFVAGVVLTFGLAIGATAAMFGLVTRLMLAAPSGIGDPERVAHIRLTLETDDGVAFMAGSTSYPAFQALHDVRTAFAGVAATHSVDSVNIGREPNTTRIAILGASGDYFATLAAVPTIGRFFGPTDDLLPAGNSVLVLGHAYWKRAFGGDRAVVGREIIVDDQPFTIIGVAARGFNGDATGAVDAFMPLTTSLRTHADGWATNRNLNLVSVVVRLRAATALPVARQAATAAVREQIFAGRGSAPSVDFVSIVPDKSSRQSPQAQIALWLAGVTIVVLLIATANVGTLLSLRAARRRRDTAVRIALGASRRQLARQLLIESVLLALIGAGVGLVLSRWFAEIVRVTLLPNLAVSEQFVDGRVLALSVTGAVAAGILAGVAPLVQLSRTTLAGHLRSGGHGSSARFTFQHTLVSIQVALCTLLVIGAALFVRSLQRVQSQDLGFSTANLLYVTLDFRGFMAGVERDMAYTDAVDHLRGATGVSAVTAVQGVPFGPHSIPPISVPGLDRPPTIGGQVPIMYGATPEYLRMMGVRVTAGRAITARDDRGANKVVLINETMARVVWPDQSPLGRCIRIGYGSFPPTEDDPAASQPCREIVGIVRDSRARSLRPEGNEDKLMQYYVPFEQLPELPIPNRSQVMALMVLVTGNLDRAAALVQRRIQSTSAVRVSARVHPYQDFFDPQLRSWRLGASLFSAFGALALCIAAVGLFAVVSFVVAQRTQEIGVRLALGASRHGVARLVVGDAMRMVSKGIVAGVVGALGAGPLLASMLFQTSPREPASMAAAGVVLLLATLIAAAWPAWQAGRVNPVVALRADG